MVFYNGSPPLPFPACKPSVCSGRRFHCADKCLRLQALNLPIVGSRGQLLACLKRALPGKAITPPNPQKRCMTTVKTRQLGRPKRKSTTNRTDGEPATRPASRVNEDEDSSLSDNALFSSIEEMIESGPEPVAFASQPTTVFSPAQCSAIKDLVSESICSALSTFQTSSAAHLPSSTNQSCCTPGLASPLDLSRPLDKSLEDKICRGEYIDFALLLRTTCISPRPLKSSLDDSSSGPMGSPVTMVRKKKPVIDTFQKWLHAYMAYMIVLVSACPCRALELIKYQQIISRAVTKFKGLAWLLYDQQFCRQAPYNLSLSWDNVDLKLWRVTFAGLAKPHWNVCSSPYHAEDVCPSANLTGDCGDPKPRALISTSLPVAVTAATRTYAAAAIPPTTPPQTAPSNSPTMPASPLNPVSVARNKVEQQRCNQRPLVSSPIDIYRLELELTHHPYRNFLVIYLVCLRRVLALVIQGCIHPGSPLT